VKTWTWTCDECGATGLHFSEEAARAAMAAHHCQPEPVKP